MVPLKWKPSAQSEGKLLKIGATGTDGFNLALLFRSDSCQLAAAEWMRPQNAGDAMTGRTAPEGGHVERLDLLDHKEFDGIRLPGRIRTSTNGVPRFEQKLVRVRINPQQ